MSKGATPSCKDGYGMSVKVAPFLEWIKVHLSRPTIYRPTSQHLTEFGADVLCAIRIEASDFYQLVVAICTNNQPWEIVKRALYILLQQLLELLLERFLTLLF